MIGVFDSGVGGLTVVKQLIKYLPKYKIIYFGDTARVPYGNKSKETIIKYSLENTAFLLSKGAKIIVIACHTASALSVDELRKKYPKVPIFDVVEPGLWKSLSVTRKNRIGVIGTEATIQSKAHKNFLIKKNSRVKVFAQACPLLVPLVEENWISKSETKSISRSYLSYFDDKNIDTLVLACTHYPALRSIISQVIAKDIKILDPSMEVAKEIKNYFESKKITRMARRKNDYYASDLPHKFGKIGERLLGEKIKIVKV